MPIFSKNFPSLRQLTAGSTRRALTTGSSLEQAVLLTTSSLTNNTNPIRKNWPAREESYAAYQLLRQKQLKRTWSSRATSHLEATNMFRSVSRLDHAAPRRMPGMTTHAQARTRLANDNHSRSIADSDGHWRSYSDQEHGRGEFEMRNAQDRYQNMDRMDAEDEQNEQEMTVRSVRETVFGPAESNEDDERERYRADDELLRRVTAVRPEAPQPSISKKVISPYNSYRNHRTRWAEFRHGMIYGRSSY
ncbi:uncharacterized protein Dana_GF12600 [Drosophila ananassae]|uniref:Uncharacterized protein n=1 Tax=Drosophila ananassae TaxID=7217 RepID=B3MG07_DROAN|nr:uncharacterized protein LOC6495449 [Drosophila ananassae]EDV35689.1 uncharacterized protein Dana_GF12600 [Drosophila ananassae]